MDYIPVDQRPEYAKFFQEPRKSWFEKHIGWGSVFFIILIISFFYSLLHQDWDNCGPYDYRCQEAAESRAQEAEQYRYPR